MFVKLVTVPQILQHLFQVQLSIRELRSQLQGLSEVPLCQLVAAWTHRTEQEGKTNQVVPSLEWSLRVFDRGTLCWSTRD